MAASPLPAAAPTIADYAAIGDCKTLALVSKFGSIDWLCLPHFSGASLFAALLDAERGGRFAIAPREIVQAGQAYLEDSNVLRTVMRCRTGVVELLDCMAVATGDVRRQRELAPAHELQRIVRCREGEGELHAVFQPRPGYAARLPHLTRRGRLGWQCTLAGTTAHLLSSLPFEPAGPATLEAVARLRAGEQHEASLSSSENEISVVLPLGGALQQRLEGTLAWWRNWCHRCT